jgi:hypothetical protein
LGVELDQYVLGSLDRTRPVRDIGRSMNIRSSFLALAFAIAGSFTVSSLAHADAHAHEGEDMSVHNKTGHEVVVFLFQDDHVHLEEAGGTQLAHLKDAESAVAHVPNCKFSILLVDHNDVWHAEFHDCHSTDMTFKMDTGHATKAKH